MSIRRAARAPMIGLAALAFVLAFLACGAATASDVERQIPVVRDAAGSGLTIEISREGTRQTATPFLTLSDPTLRRIEYRIGKATARLGAKVTFSEETVEDAVPRTGIGGGEITIRKVRNFLKGVRTTRKGKPAPAAVAAVPEQRIGLAAASPRGAR